MVVSKGVVGGGNWARDSRPSMVKRTASPSPPPVRSRVTWPARFQAIEARLTSATSHWVKKPFESVGKFEREGPAVVGVAVSARKALAGEADCPAAVKERLLMEAVAPLVEERAVMRRVL